MNDIKIRRRSFDPNDCRAIQKLYHSNRKKALRVVLDDEPDFCGQNPEIVATHYTDTVSSSDDVIDYLEFYAKSERKINEMLSRCEIKN